MRGKFISVEGGEGVGKSTNIEFIRQTLADRGIDVLVTREPGGTPLAEEIREILLARREESMVPSTELLLVFAARAQHLQRVILPALEKGQWVVSDRFTDATFAYQGYGRGLSLDDISDLEILVQKGLHPDVTILLDIDVEIGLQRARQRASLDRFEMEEIDFFKRVRQGYLARLNEEPERFALVNAGQELDAVQMDIAAVLQRLFV